MFFVLNTCNNSYILLWMHHIRIIQLLGSWSISFDINYFWINEWVWVVPLDRGGQWHHFGLGTLMSWWENHGFKWIWKEGSYIQQKHGFKKLNLWAMFGSNRPTQNDRHDRGIISCFLWKSETALICTSRISVLGVAPIFSFFLCNRFIS